MSDCIFCRIAAGTIPATVVARNEHVMAFRDLNPQAPTHVLVVPRSHYADAAELAHHEPATMAGLVAVAAAVADDEGLDGQYRMVLNTGEEAGQSVFHTHLHLLGGRSMGWPPG